ncbi:hypothetical protein TNCV_3451551 [Trichonephila clavipes]|nr:hypothetical protein TNCV_3451551 [Trichonephila clavipes]
MCLHRLTNKAAPSLQRIAKKLNLLEGLPIFGPAGTPTAIPTKLGYILSGKIYAPPLKESIVNSSLNDQLSELWKLKEVPKTNAKIQIPDPCEESFQNR